MRQAALDGVRGLACLAVVFYHAQVPGFAWGYMGVQLFFGLSGYVITGALLRREAAPFDLWRFWGRRLRRLLPPLAGMVVVVSAAAIVAHRATLGQALTPALYALGYVMDVAWFRGWDTGLLGHVWTLAVELRFYAVMPFLAPVLIRMGGAAGPALMVLALGSCGAYFLGTATYFTNGENPAPFLLGAAAACRPLPAVSWLRRALEWRPLAALGLISYGVYLWGYPIDKVAAGLPWTARLAVDCAVAVPAAIVSYLTVERWAGCAREALWPRVGRP